MRSGDVATDLQRPVDLQRAFFAQDVGRACYQLVYRAAPQFLLGALLSEVTIPSERPAPVALVPARRDERGRADRGGRGARPPVDLAIEESQIEEIVRRIYVTGAARPES